ncbi:EVE domain-containing protein [Zavarzinia sp. CC-PAN008]|uniref:EVE domain-containing protein n=1 Tax=Zavarzinia sp. CC-PAN008 TaxID=3243332 RepID=UPI003F74388A
MATQKRERQYFLVKSEPSVWSWDDQVRDGTTHWNGVRNHQAAAHMRAMRKGDRAFFYHSNEQKAVVGIVEVAREWYPDPSDETGKFGLVDLKAVKPLPRPVSLADIKATPELAGIALVRQSRLSVMALEKDAWDRIAKMGGLRV